jgi:hypothetical protein
MVELAAEQPGYLGIETCRGEDGFGITVSYWQDEAFDPGLEAQRRAFAGAPARARTVVRTFRAARGAGRAGLWRPGRRKSARGRRMSDILATILARKAAEVQERSTACRCVNWRALRLRHCAALARLLATSSCIESGSPSGPGPGSWIRA